LMLTGFLKNALNEFNLSPKDVSQYSPLALAYIGDAVYEVFIRTLIISETRAPVHMLHKRSVDFVKAKAQSDTIHRIMDSLTPDEQDIVRRGRNSKSGTIPKNADVTEYRYATGFESLIGFLYLMQEHDRLMQVLKMSITENKNQD